MNTKHESRYEQKSARWYGGTMPCAAAQRSQSFSRGKCRGDGEVILRYNYRNPASRHRRLRDAVQLPNVMILFYC